MGAPQEGDRTAPDIHSIHAAIQSLQLALRRGDAEAIARSLSLLESLTAPPNNVYICYAEATFTDDLVEVLLAGAKATAETASHLSTVSFSHQPGPTHYVLPSITLPQHMPSSHWILPAVAT